MVFEISAVIQRGDTILQGPCSLCSLCRCYSFPHRGAWGSRVYAAEILFIDLAITQCEMYNIVVALKLWGHE